MTKDKKHPVIALSPVESSQISQIGYDSATNTMAVQFKSKSGTGSTYHYANVTPDHFSDFQKSKSVGSHFIKHFKPAADKFPHVKVG